MVADRCALRGVATRHTSMTGVTPDSRGVMRSTAARRWQPPVVVVVALVLLALLLALDAPIPVHGQMSVRIERAQRQLRKREVR